MNMRRFENMRPGQGMRAVVALVVIALSGCERREIPAASTSQPSTQASLPKQVTTPAGTTMALIPGGTFRMGHEGEIDAEPPHDVTVSPFYIDVCEVTQAAYQKIVGKNPSRTKGDDRPVERVRWTAAIRYCNAMSEREGLKPCYDVATGACSFAADGYRLPTEAEWEHAARAGSTGDYSFQGPAGALAKHAWFDGNAGGRPHSVGKKPPNAFGLHDMLGNVREWCNDWYAVDAYEARAEQGTVKDPHGPAKGEKKVLRGGAWSVSAESCTTWARYADDPGFSDACLVEDDCGFRCVRPARLTPR